MKVKATLPMGQVGFYGGRRLRDGDLFLIESEADLGSWMVPVEKPKAKTVELTRGQKAAKTRAANKAKKERGE